MQTEMHSERQPERTQTLTVSPYLLLLSPSIFQHRLGDVAHDEFYEVPSCPARPPGRGSEDRRARGARVHERGGCCGDCGLAEGGGQEGEGGEAFAQGRREGEGAQEGWAEGGEEGLVTRV